ncbi:hypothetical protein [Methanoculleus sp.]|uniref:hypothetical protein n=1 Tax=Methanoculleus sp. TaxID=90427 RepID=UPI002639E942|nr:hypothetical protein [Methanoculleus sp.]MDI6867876.1 hypothetical protein [Methanoculleus sp.]
MKELGESGARGAAAGCIHHRGTGAPVKGGNCDGSKASPEVPLTRMHQATTHSYDYKDIRLTTPAGWVR